MALREAALKVNKEGGLDEDTASATTTATDIDNIEQLSVNNWTHYS